MAKKRFKVSPEKQEWLDQFQPDAVLKGEPLNCPVTLQNKYAIEVNKIMTEVFDTTEKEVENICNTTAAEALFIAGITTVVIRRLGKLFKNLDKAVLKKASRAVERMVIVANESSQRDMNASLSSLSDGLKIKTSLFSKSIRDKLRASIKLNVDLVTSISRTYLEKVESAVYRLIVQGRGFADLVPFMKKQRGITKRQAKNTVFDQTRKTYNAFNMSRMEDAGVRFFEWVHGTIPREPRIFHISRAPKGLNGGIFEMNKPPIIDKKTGVRGFPGDLRHCQCRINPVLVFAKGEAA